MILILISVVGKELVHYLVEGNFVPDEAAAIEFGQLLARLDLIHHVVDEHEFKNDDLFYRFRSDDSPEEKAKGPSVAQLSIGCSVAEQGFLQLKLPFFGWRQVYCLLRADECKLYRFASDLSPSPSDVLDLTSCTAVVQEELTAKKDHYGFSIRVDDKNGESTTNFCAHKSKDQEEWLEALTNAGAQFHEDAMTKANLADSLFDFTSVDIDGNEKKLSDFRGQVCLVVNVASF